MYQAPAQLWNQIAETQELRTAWAQQMFPLPEDDLEMALTAEELRLSKVMGSAKLAAAYLTVMPLLWEAEAIQLHQTEFGPNASIPPLATVQEAVIVASRDFGLTTAQQATLQKQLSTEPDA